LPVLLNAQLQWVATGGKETALYLLLLALAFRFTLAPMRSASIDGHSVWVGVLWSLVPLARLTPASLILTGLGFAWIGQRRPAVRSWIAWLSGPVLWATAAWIMFDHVWPTSGSIKSQRFVEAVSSGRILDDLPAIVGTLPSYALELGRFSVGLPSQFVRSAPALSRPFVLTLGAMAALGIFVRRQSLDRRLAVAALGALASVIAVVAVLRYRPDETYYFGTWYHAEIPLLVALYIGFGLSAWPKALTTSTVGLFAGLVILGIPNTSRHQLGAFKPNPGELQYVIAETAAHLNSLAGIHQMRIASWNAGLLGFLTNTAVINLDGLANEDILRVGVADASIGGYLLQEGVHLLVDARLAGAPLRLGEVELSIVHVTPWSGPPEFEPGWFVMEVRRP
jgi:hypothetical protein